MVGEHPAIKRTAVIDAMNLCIKMAPS